MSKTCETTSKEKLCGKVAVAKVKLRNDKRPFFNVCKDCLPAYNYIQGKEYGNTESSFIVEKFAKSSGSEE